MHTCIYRACCMYVVHKLKYMYVVLDIAYMTCIRNDILSDMTLPALGQKINFTTRQTFYIQLTRREYPTSLISPIELYPPILSESDNLSTNQNYYRNNGSLFKFRNV